MGENEWLSILGTIYYLEIFIVKVRQKNLKEAILTSLTTFL